ncbi:MAG TPA: F0F1 ATP synthase subunit delta, partial [Opitutales bacterium]|nr:F0F1 ATP synthase subunit delta [Opitutales bacterium]
GPADENFVSSIQTSLEQRTSRPLTRVEISTPSLIAGLRVTVGDNVWESSVKSRLEQFDLN